MSPYNPIMKNLIGNESADDLATEILDVTEGSNVREGSGFYVFVYRAKTLALHTTHILLSLLLMFSLGDFVDLIIIGEK